MAASAGSPPVSPKTSVWLMAASYVVAGVGIFFGFLYFTDGATAFLKPVALLSVGGLGLLSFVRHSVFHRSDAARMHWDMGRRNDFQIEVGLANLAWGLVAIAAVGFGWGVAAMASVVLVFGLYLVFAALLHVSNIFKSKAQGGGRFGPTIALLVMGGVLFFFAVAGLADRHVPPF